MHVEVEFWAPSVRSSFSVMWLRVQGGVFMKLFVAVIWIHGRVYIYSVSLLEACACTCSLIVQEDVKS